MYVCVCLCIRNTHTIFIHRSFIGFTWLTVYAYHALTSMLCLYLYMIWHKHALLYALHCFRFRSGAYTFPCCFHLYLRCCMLFVAMSVSSTNQRLNVFRFVSFRFDVFRFMRLDSIEPVELIHKSVSVYLYLTVYKIFMQTLRFS